MTSDRPLARDEVSAQAWPVVARWQASAEVGPPCRQRVTHSYAALAFYTAGHSRMEVNGRWELQAGDALLVPAGQPHRRIESRGAEFWGLAFCAPCFASEGAAELLEPFERVREGAAAVVRIPAHRQAFLEGLFGELAEVGRELRAGGTANVSVQRSLLTLVLNEVERAARQDLRLASAAATAKRALPTSVVADSLRFIERNCLRRLTLQDVAAAVGRSPAYVTHALSQATGRSAGEWIVSGRMAEARRLLAHSDERVDIIAERVGYADATHFIRMFRRQHGATPAAWRAARAAATLPVNESPVKM